MCTARLSKEPASSFAIHCSWGGDVSEHHISSYGKNKQLEKPTPSFSLQYLRVPSSELPGSYSILKCIKDVFPRSAHLPMRTLLPGTTSAQHRTGADQVGESYLPASSLHKPWKYTQIHRPCKSVGAALRKRLEASKFPELQPVAPVSHTDDRHASKHPVSVSWSIQGCLCEQVASVSLSI